MTRKSRAGQDSHPSGHRVGRLSKQGRRHLAAHAAIKARREAEAPADDDEPEVKRSAGVSLPRVRFLEKKMIGGELI